LKSILVGSYVCFGIAIVTPIGGGNFSRIIALY